jgi:hypothetical protein
VKSAEALPLLAFALRDLDKRFGRERRLAIADYEKLGDPAAQLSPIENAVLRRAEETCSALAGPVARKSSRVLCASAKMHIHSTPCPGRPPLDGGICGRAIAEQSCGGALARGSERLSHRQKAFEQALIDYHAANNHRMSFSKDFSSGGRNTGLPHDATVYL